jgi:predicted TIM-barrel fold metal-dependent hydrolase
MFAMYLAMLSACASNAGSRGSPPPIVDHHQHFFRTGIAGTAREAVPFGGTALVHLLDDASIRRAVVLSTAYQPGNPNRPAASDEYAQVRAENDWTSQQVSLYPDRLVGLCGFNPLRDYALQELRRCAADPNLRSGIKLHFGNSDVRLDDPHHLGRLTAVFAEADRHCMAIVVHLHPSVSMRRPYGAAQARAFIDSVLPSAPHVIVQIAHLGGATAYAYDDPGQDEAVSVFVAAIKANDPRMRNVYFDISGAAGIGERKADPELVVRRMRELGVRRMLFGSDGAVPGNAPSEAWAAFKELPLSKKEFSLIAGNVAPYLRSDRGHPSACKAR